MSLKEDYHVKLSNEFNYEVLKTFGKNMNEELSKVETLFKNEFSELDKMLMMEKIFKKYYNKNIRNNSKYLDNLIKYLLPTPKDLIEQEKNETVKINCIVASILLYKIFIEDWISYMKYLSSNIHEKTTRTENFNHMKKVASVREFYDFDRLIALLNGFEVLSKSTSKYIEFKSCYVKMKGYMPTSGYMEAKFLFIEELRSLMNKSIILDEFSAHTYIRTLVEAELNEKINYTSDDRLTPFMKRITPKIIIKSIIDCGYRLDIETDMLTRVYGTCSGSIHKARRPETVKIYFMSILANRFSGKIRKLKILPEDREKIILKIRDNASKKK